MGDVTHSDSVLFYIERADRKRCTKCRKIKALDAFSKGDDAFGKKHHCQACNVLALRAWREKPGNRARLDRMRRNSRLRLDYGIDIECFERMVAEQRGLCAICRNPPGAKGLHVDHHHGTGKVRRLLCGACNLGLGQFRDDPAVLRAAADYLDEHAGGDGAVPKHGNIESGDIRVGLLAL